MAFQLRLLNLSAYRDLTARLSSARSDPGALRAVVAQCQAALVDEALLRYNSAYEWLLDEWRQALGEAPSGSPGETVDRIAEIAIATCCMPQFQYSPHAAPVRSPNLVLLADYDAGLYGVLADADPWFDRLFAERFPVAAERYIFGSAMIVLEGPELRRLLETIEKASPTASRAPGPARVLESLRSLVGRALATEGHALAVSEFG